MKTAMCIDLGCSENALDGELIARYLETNEWQLVEHPEEADLIIVNSCGVTEATAQTSLATYRHMVARRRPGARVVFAGCLPAMDRPAVRAAGYDGDLITPRSLYRLDGLTEARVPIDAVRSGCVPVSADGLGTSFRNPRHARLQRALQVLLTALRWLPLAPVPRWLWQYGHYPDADTEFVRISVGCMNACAFCAIPRAKGRTRSVPPEIVVERVRDAVRRGKVDVALSCDELASYGQDLGTDIVDLLRRLSDVAGRFRLSLRNVHAEWLLRYWSDLEPVFRMGRVGYMVLPVQSGCDRILRQMARNHTAAEYLSLVRRIRAASPGTVLRTHVIVGFPGETEADFAETCRFVRALPVDSVFATAYSERAHTAAAKIEPKVPVAVARARMRRVRSAARAGLLRPGRWRPLRPPRLPG